MSELLSLELIKRLPKTDLHCGPRSLALVRMTGTPAGTGSDAP